MNNDELMKETYRLAHENNRMLRSMRRHAFWGGLIRLLIYGALLLVPVWIYFTYLAPMLETMMATVQEVQGTGAQAKAQFTSFQEILQQYRDLVTGTN